MSGVMLATLVVPRKSDQMPYLLDHPMTYPRGLMSNAFICNWVDNASPSGHTHGTIVPPCPGGRPRLAAPDVTPGGPSNPARGLRVLPRQMHSLDAGAIRPRRLLRSPRCLGMPGM